MGILSKLLTPSKDKVARQTTRVLKQLGVTGDNPADLLVIPLNG